MKPLDVKAGPIVFVARRVYAKGCALSAHAKSTAAALATFADAEGVAFPSLETLAERTGLARSTVANAIRELTSGESPIFAKGKRRRGNTYAVVWSPAKFAEARDRSRTVRHTDGKTVPESGTVRETDTKTVPSEPSATRTLRDGNRPPYGLVTVRHTDAKKDIEDGVGSADSGGEIETVVLKGESEGGTCVPIPRRFPADEETCSICGTREVAPRSRAGRCSECHGARQRARDREYHRQRRRTLRSVTVG